MAITGTFTFRYPLLSACVLLSLLILPAYGQAPVPGYPNDIGAYDSRELAMLPPYCIYTLPFPASNNTEKVEYYKSIMGPTVSGKPRHLFDTMHHYCWGLMKSNRGKLLARTEQARNFYLRSSIGEFDYVLGHAPENFALLPEILTRKGENLLRLRDVATGIRALERAIQIKPDYWPSYVAISDFYVKSGKPDAARDVLKKGLSAAPDSAALRAKLNELDASATKRPMTAPAAEG